MAAIESARIRAAQLHLSLVADGINVWDLNAIVQALAKREDVRIIAVPRDDPRLGNSEGAWDPESRFAFIAETGDPFRESFVAAHELGHAIIGEATKTEFSKSIEPTRACDDPEIGADRIWDYSRRERKEVTMDLFARELLMPRSWLRRLYLEENMLTEDVAKRLGAPHDVVAQQMLDALLLPKPPASETSKGPAPTGLDPSQERAATHTGSAYLLEAGPGTGKTRTLVARIEHLLASGVEAAQILVLTFSNRAAAELTERIAATRPSEAAAMWIGTFHSFGLDLVQRFGARLGLPENPRPLDLSSSMDLVEDAYGRLPLVHFRDLYDPTDQIVGLIRAVSRAKDECVSPERYRELADAMEQNDPEACAKAREVALFYAAYEQLKRQAKSVDFGDLVYLPVVLVERHDDVLSALRNRHRHILVDEYQDVNHASVRLLSALAGTGENLWAVGDARQSIYRFRGASSANMRVFRKTFPSASLGRLEVNYRSSERIVGLFNGFARTIPVDAGEGPRARPDFTGHFPELLACGNKNGEAAAIASKAKELQGAGHEWRDQAIIVKGNDRLSEVARQVEAKGVPVLFLGVLFEREEIRDLLALLSLAQDRHASGLIRLSASPDFKMPLADARNFAGIIKSDGGSYSGWPGEGLPRSDMTEASASALTRIDAVFDGSKGRLTPWLACVRAVLDVTDVARRIAMSDSVADRSRGIAIWQFLNYARTFSPTGPWPNAAEFLKRIRRIVRVSDERDLRRLPPFADHIDAVRMMTIHGAKGLEFDVVHLPGMHARSMPGPSNPPHCIPPDGMIAGSDGLTGRQAVDDGIEEEKRCLLYVALSRAKVCLQMYRQSQGANITTFLKDLGGLFQERTSEAPSTAEPIDGAQQFDVRFDTGIFLSVSQAAQYDTCPRRFFYTHVLKIGGKREETPYTRMHEAVQQLVDACSARAHGSAIGRAEFDTLMQQAWDANGPTEHGQADGYRALADGLAGELWGHVSGRMRHDVGRTELRLPGGTVFHEFAEASVGNDGILNVLRIRTGKSRDSDLKSLETSLLRVVADQLGRPVRFRLVNLADGADREVPAASASDRKKAESALAGIAAGDFPLKVSSRTCPKCPHYFLCGRSGGESITVRL